MIVINGTVTEELKKHLVDGGTHPLAKKYGNLIIAGGIGVGGGELPSGYTKQECLESVRGQYINTGFAPNQDTRVIVQAEFLDKNTSFLLGARHETNDRTYCILSLTGVLRSDYHTVLSQTAINALAKVLVDKNKNTTTINSDVVTAPYKPFQCEHSIFLFALNSNGQADQFAKAKIYMCQIYDDGVLVRDFVPCIRDSDETAGMYDKANGVFYPMGGAALLNEIEYGG